MRFRFCGDLDCPDWVLAEVLCPKLETSVKMKLLCIQVIKTMLGQGIDVWCSQNTSLFCVPELCEEGDVKASIAALHFILASAAKYTVGGESLANELQQLGLPKEHTTSLGKSYGDSLTQLQEQFRKDSLKCCVSVSMSQLEGVEWRVDYTVSSSLLKDINEACVQLKMNVQGVESGNVEPMLCTPSFDKFRVFLNELKQASSMMDNLTSS